MICDIVSKINNSTKKIFLIYGFNGVGKTRLSNEYIQLTKNENGKTGLYYNSYSEDIFKWKNFDDSDEGICLEIIKTGLNKEHSVLNEIKIEDKLQKYNFNFSFEFTAHTDTQEGIKHITFSHQDAQNIKISRVEEHVFIWCFFQCIFSNSLDDSEFLFIDDPISSLDENNLFKIASDVYTIIEENHETKKIIITTHNIFFYNILANWLTKGEKAGKFKNKTELFIMHDNGGDHNVTNIKKGIILYHLDILNHLKTNLRNGLKKSDFSLLRQLIENLSSFLGCGRANYVLEKIGLTNPDDTMKILNALSHKNIFNFESNEPTSEQVRIFKDVFEGIRTTFPFILGDEDD